MALLMLALTRKKKFFYYFLILKTEILHNEYSLLLVNDYLERKLF